MPCNESLCAGLGDGLRGLDAGTLRGVQILLVADDVESFAFQVVKKEIASAPETRIKRGVESGAGGGKDDLHCSVNPLCSYGPN